MKKVLFLIFLLLIPLLAKPNDTLQAGLFNIVPYAYENKNGKVQGITYEIIQNLQLQSGLTIKTSLLPYKRMLDYLESGKIDFGIFFLSDYSESFSDKLIALYDLQTIVIGKKGLKIKSYKDLSTLSLATPLGVNYNAKLSKDRQLNIILVRDYTNAILMLENGNIDAIVGPKKIIEFQLKLLGKSINQFGSPYVLITNTAWIQFSNQSKQNKYKKTLIRAAKTLLEKGKISDIIQKYYP